MAGKVYCPANEEFLNGMTERIICLIYLGQENIQDFTIRKGDKAELLVPCLEEARFRFLSESVGPYKALTKDSAI